MGFTPKTYLEKTRILKAKELLIQSSLNNTDICFTVGFQSLSQFYSSFRKQTGYSPKQYREMNKL
jgi:AraC family transcriptional regulator of adaptative response / methylphosphotriester-DNA alkyltransferase methyltransferase